MLAVKAFFDLEPVLSSDEVPALPRTAACLLKLSQNPNNGPAEFAVPIESDPGLAGQVLRFVNSSFFGLAREVSSVRQAVTLIGMRKTRNFVMWNAVFNMMPNPRCGPFDLDRLWQDSLRRALFARNLATLLGLKEAEDVFAGALLQDMAIPLLAKQLPRQYLKLLEARGGGDARLSVLERAEFGWSHAEAAGLIARKWRLPDEFAQLIEAHTSLDRMLEAGCSDISKLAVALSAFLPASQDQQWCERDAFFKAFDHLAANRGQPVEALFGQVDLEFSEFAPILRLAVPATPLTHYLADDGADL